MRPGYGLPSGSSKPVRSCSPRLGRFDSGAAPLSQSRRADGPRGARCRDVQRGGDAGRDRSEPLCAVADCGGNVAVVGVPAVPARTLTMTRTRTCAEARRQAVLGAPMAFLQTRCKHPDGVGTRLAVRSVLPWPLWASRERREPGWPRRNRCAHERSRKATGRLRTNQRSLSPGNSGEPENSGPVEFPSGEGYLDCLSRERRRLCFYRVGQLASFTSASRWLIMVAPRAPLGGT